MACLRLVGLPNRDHDFAPPALPDRYGYEVSLRLYLTIDLTCNSSVGPDVPPADASSYGHLASHLHSFHHPLYLDIHLYD